MNSATFRPFSLAEHCHTQNFYLKNEDDFKNENNLKNKDNIKNEEDLKMKTTSKWMWIQNTQST